MPSYADSQRDFTEPGEDLPGFCQADTVVMGCGNRLLGDDGFGPALISYLRDYAPVPKRTVLLDAGTGISRLLFDMALSPSRPRRLIVVDAMRLGLPPGTVSVLPLDSFTTEHTRTFAEHQEPTSCLLKELRDLSGIEVTLLVAEPEFMPGEVSPGLSPAIQRAVLKAGRLIEPSLTQAHSYPSP